MSYGFIRPWYRDTVKPRGASTPVGGFALTPGQQYAVSFPSLYTDYLLRAGHKLHFVFANSASGLSIPAFTGNIVTMQTGPGLSQVRVPIASGPGFVPTVAVGGGGGLPGTATAGSEGAGLPLGILACRIAVAAVLRWSYSGVASRSTI